MTIEEKQINEAASKYALDNYGVPSITCKGTTFDNAVEDFICGAESPEAKAFHTKRMYSEEEVREIIDQIDDLYRPYHRNNILGWEYFEQNKKK